ncbi:MAG: outer-membrane lipoprotein carrier protein LolA [Prevotella sp.]|nr:outer-membrane lipoprotein carrier protein LolA [Prevotella sp.]
MKRFFVALVALITMSTAMMAQTAQQVLDKCAALVSAPEGATANFSMTSAQYGNAAGTISIKGQKFYMKSNTMTMWFDGTTLWSYLAQNEEVNISTPTAQQLQTLNPYHFINLYKQGYTATMTTSATAYTVHLTATDTQKKISEAFITIDKTTYAPKDLKMLQGTKWTSFTISGLKAERQDDSKFRFNSSAYPDAEIIDLR